MTSRTFVTIALRTLVAAAAAMFAIALMSCGGGDGSSGSRAAIPRPQGTPVLVYTTAVTVNPRQAVSTLYEKRAGSEPEMVTAFAPNDLAYLLLGSPDGNYIAMTKGGYEVIVNRHGEEVQRLGIPATSSTGAGPFASWSADSTLFAYSRITIEAPIPANTPQLSADDTADAGWVEVVDVAGRNVITPGWLQEDELSQPAFSPFGFELAAVDYVSAGSGTRPLVVVDREKRRRVLTDEPLANKALPLWSPDGKWVAYWVVGAVIREGHEKETGTFVVPEEGGPPKLLAISQYPGPQSWSADGKHIALSCLDETAENSLGTPPTVCLVDIDSGEVQRFGEGFGAALSPDGESIAYLTEPDRATGTFTLKTVRIDDGTEETISKDVLFGGMTWVIDSPDATPVPTP